MPPILPGGNGSGARRVDATMQVEIWSDVVCPWCYLGKRQFEQALAGFGHRGAVEVVYRSFELDPSAPPGVTAPTVATLAGKHGMTLDQARDPQRQMEKPGAPFFVSGRRYAISGAQPPELIAQVLDRAWAETQAA